MQQFNYFKINLETQNLVVTFQVFVEYMENYSTKITDV